MKNEDMELKVTKQRENKFHKYILTVQSALIAESVTFPLDITKTRLQLQNELSKGSMIKYRGMFATAIGIIQEESFTGLYQGLPPALLRHIIYSGIRIGLYEQIRNALKGNQDSFPLWKKAIAGALGGAIGQLFASPTDLVKVRLQAQRKASLFHRLKNDPKVPPPRTYNGTIDAFRTIMKEEGMVGLWKGVSPNVQRAALVNLGELATYDESKELIVKSGLFSADSIVTHTIAGILSGLAATIASCPADVVKTRMMNQYMYNTGQQLYRSSIDCLIKSVKSEGFLALYKGFFPTWARLGPWQLTFWIVYEQLRIWTGLGTF